MKTTLLLLALFFSSARASSLPSSKGEFCLRFEDAETIFSFSQDESNLMAFKNQGGLFNGGVCWWHSRFQRNIFYLAIMRPELPRPKEREIRALIKEIRAGEKVVTIPGFKSFLEFSETYQKEILKELESWQLYDGVVLGSWIDGLKGDTKVRPSVLKGMMDELYLYVENQKKIAYQKLQIKGITSHAWLVVGMKKGPNGYEVGLIDSNNPRMCENYSYKFGDESFFEKSYGNFVPYLEFKREEERLQTVALAYCKKTVLSAETKDKWQKDYALDLSEAKKNKADQF